MLRVAGNVFAETIRRSQAGKRAASEISLGLGDLERFLGERSPLSAATPQPLNRVLNGETERILREALRELPAQMRQCVTLRLFQDLRYREIAEVLRISVDSVKVQLARGRRRLRRRLCASLGYPSSLEGGGLP